MSTTYMAAGITIVLALNSMSEAMRLREYRRPVCSPEQSCFYEAFGMVFALCDCPGEDRSCPQEEEHSIEHRGTMYSFCEARDIPLCKDGDISTSVKGIQTAVHCICPDQNELVQMPGEQKDRTNYVCRQKRLCRNDEACGLRSLVGDVRLCECRTGLSCVYSSDIGAPLSRQAGKCRSKP